MSERMKNLDGVTKTIVICVTIIAFFTILYSGGKNTNETYRNIVNTCITSGAQWINGSCIRGHNNQ